MPQMGHPAPDFTLPRDGGGSVTLSALRPKAVVLYFYPKDDTSGCTAQARDFTDAADRFAAIDTYVIGVSKDSIARHDKFRDKHDLDVMLLSDAENDVCERYGVWVEKSMYGKKFMGIERSTFLLDGAGQVAQVWRKVKVAGHVDSVLEAATSLHGG